MKEFIHTRQAAGTFSRGVAKKGSSTWLWLLVVAAVSSAACLLTGLAISMLSIVGLINASRTLAYSTVAFLFASFVLMFVSAHCMDRISAERKEAAIAYARYRDRLSHHPGAASTLNDSDFSQD